MAKKRQTTGTPKRKRVVKSAEQGKKPERVYRSRAEREAEIQRLVIRGTVAALIILVVIIAVTFIVDRVVLPSQAVVTVNGESVTVRDFQARLRFERLQINQQLNNVVNQLRSFGMDDNQILQQLQQQPPYSDWLNELNFPDQLGQRVIDELIDDLLIAQYAEANGITVDEADIEKARDVFFNFEPTATALAVRDLEPTETPIPTETPTPYVSPTPTPTATPTATPDPEATVEATAEATAEATEAVSLPTPLPTPTLSAERILENYQTLIDNFNQAIRSGADVDQAFIDDFFRRLALRQAVRDAVTADVPETAVWANVRHILVETEEEAQDILDALAAGESFASLAQAVSQDSGSGARGGELGWSPVDNYVDEFEAAVLEAPLGEIVGPVQTQFGYHILQVRAREERERDEAEMEAAKDRAFEAWLQEYRDDPNNEIEINDIWLDYTS